MAFVKSLGINMLLQDYFFPSFWTFWTLTGISLRSFQLISASAISNPNSTQPVMANAYAVQPACVLSLRPSFQVQVTLQDHFVRESPYEGYLCFLQRLTLRHSFDPTTNLHTYRSSFELLSISNPLDERKCLGYVFKFNRPLVSTRVWSSPLNPIDPEILISTSNRSDSPYHSFLLDEGFYSRTWI